MAEVNGTNGVPHSSKTDYDVVVIGAGFAGIRIVPELRKLGLSFKVYEAGSGVGGTWYWNRYPGARTDSESWIYILNVSDEVNKQWTWKERFPRQPEVLEYLNYVADEFDMQKDMQFNTRMTKAHWDESSRIWNFETEAGEKVSSKYFISCTGVLSVGRDLPFKGADKFQGE
jgi:cation diffusion facilitator CzcD-associated flavoprotein CzcO